MVANTPQEPLPYRGKDDDGMSHWWCQDKETDAVVDSTASQYTDNRILPPYEGGSSADWQDGREDRKFVLYAS